VSAGQACLGARQTEVILRGFGLPKRPSADTISIGMRRALNLLVCLAAVLSAGCSKRTAPMRIVYAPSVSVPAPAASPQAAGALVLAEPQPPEVEPEPRPRSRNLGEASPKPRVRLAPADPALEPEPDVPPAVEVPTLEPREGAAAQDSQRRRVAQFQDQIRARIVRQDNPGLSAEDRRMLNDARTFLVQSERALVATIFRAP